MLLILRLFWPQTPHVSCRSKHPLVFPIHHVSPHASSPRAREGLSCSNISHRSSSPVHALLHPAPCPLQGEPGLATKPGQLAIALCLGLPLAPEGSGRKSTECRKKFTSAVPLTRPVSLSSKTTPSPKSITSARTNTPSQVPSITEKSPASSPACNPPSWTSASSATPSSTSPTSWKRPATPPTSTLTATPAAAATAAPPPSKAPSPPHPAKPQPTPPAAATAEIAEIAAAVATGAEAEAVETAAAIATVSPSPTPPHLRTLRKLRT